MNKCYVISNSNGYIKLFEDKCRIEVVSDVRDATFYDSEDFAYEDMARNKKAFISILDTFYKIECVIVVFSC